MALTIITIFTSSIPRVQPIGVNWGTNASHPLPPSKVVELLKLNKITKVKLFDANPQVLESLAGSNIDVTVGIPNSMLRTLNSSVKAAESWVHDNLTRYLADRTRIVYVAVGDEPFLQRYGSQFYPYVVGAAITVEAALIRAKLANKNISLDFALFKETAHPHNDTHKSYKNSFDLSYDTLVTALTVAGYSQIDIVISHIGWPTDGAPNATSSNAEKFMKGLLNHIRSKTGTPLRPRGMPIENYFFTLLDEDQRNIAAGNFERHWGLFTFDGQAKYQVDFDLGTKRLRNAETVEYLGSKWCVVNNNVDMSNATARALEACAGADCTALSPGGSCFNLTWPGNVSYAFNSYYQQQDQRADSCGFEGLGMITTVDPSVEDCRFNVELKASSVSLHESHLASFALTILLLLWSL